MAEDRLITNKQWNAKLRELRVAKELLRAAEAQIEALQKEGEHVLHCLRVEQTRHEETMAEAHTLTERVKQLQQDWNCEVVALQHDNKAMAVALAELEVSKASMSFLDEAFNSGDGTYRP